MVERGRAMRVPFSLLGTQQDAPMLGDLRRYICLRNPIGAGEAIRTPDPNLGKVMLYP